MLTPSHTPGTSSTPTLKDRLTKHLRTLYLGVERSSCRPLEPMKPLVAGWLWSANLGDSVRPPCCCFFVNTQVHQCTLQARWCRLFYELHDTRLIGFDNPASWGRKGSAATPRRKLEVGFALAHSEICLKLTRSDQGYAFLHPESLSISRRLWAIYISQFLMGYLHKLGALQQNI